MNKTTKKNYILAVGRRKEAVARVHLYKGKGESMVNNKPTVDYFPGITSSSLLTQPFKATKNENKYWYSVVVNGGGKESQRDAVVLGLSRALAQNDSSAFRPVLKKQGLLTRDARIRERRKVGTGGKARRQKQSPRR